MFWILSMEFTWMLFSPIVIVNMNQGILSCWRYCRNSLNSLCFWSFLWKYLGYWLMNFQVVVIFVICVVFILVTYMLFLLCLDPMLRRQKQSIPYRQQNDEVYCLYLVFYYFYLFYYFYIDYLLFIILYYYFILIFMVKFFDVFYWW